MPYRVCWNKVLRVNGQEELLVVNCGGGTQAEACATGMMDYFSN